MLAHPRLSRSWKGFSLHVATLAVWKQVASFRCSVLFGWELCPYDHIGPGKLRCRCLRFVWEPCLYSQKGLGESQMVSLRWCLHLSDWQGGNGSMLLFEVQFIRIQVFFTVSDCSTVSRGGWRVPLFLWSSFWSGQLLLVGLVRCVWNFPSCLRIVVRPWRPKGTHCLNPLSPTLKRSRSRSHYTTYAANTRPRFRHHPTGDVFPEVPWTQLPIGSFPSADSPCD